jgi:hypothetical protein
MQHCFERIDITGPRTLEIIYRKDKVNAGDVLDALRRRVRHRRRVDPRSRPGRLSS